MSAKERQRWSRDQPIELYNLDPGDAHCTSRSIILISDDQAVHSDRPKH